MAFSARMASRRRSTPSSEGSSLEWARYLVSGIARAAIQTKTSPGGEGTKAAAPAPFRGQTGGRAASFEGSLRSGEACADREAWSACSGRPGLAASVPPDDAVRRDHQGDALEERAILRAEGGRSI